MLTNPLLFFTDAVLRAPMLGSMLMCLAAGVVGVIVFLRRQSLLGESLSHAAYPGVVAGVIISGMLGLTESDYSWVAFCIMTGAFVTAFLGLWCIQWLVRRLRISSDAALCFVLSAFFGVGITLASYVQFTFSSLYRQIQAYLYGQAATMTDIHVVIYGILTFLIVATVFLFYKELQVMTFDRNFAKSLGIKTKLIDALVFTLITLAVVIGIRSVGVVLMSAMLIAPAVSARQFSNKLYKVFFLAGLFGLLSGFLGIYVSVQLNDYLALAYPGERLILPTGPSIVLLAALMCVLSLLFAPERGTLLRFYRIAGFRYRCLTENLLKTIWRLSPNQEVEFDAIERLQGTSPWYLRFLLWRLVRNGWLDHVNATSYRLTTDGKQWAANIVRLHRLWEVYLAHYVGLASEKVHRNAEEMEHIITPELERELTLLLKNPLQDPHHQPIPKQR